MIYKQPEAIEDLEQTFLFRWASFISGKHPEINLMYHIPNGGFRNKSEAGRLKAQGVKSGVPDICLPVARGGYHGLYIELKRERSGTVSTNQQEWLNSLIQQGYYAVVCHGWEKAKEVIEEYFNLRKDG